MEKDTFRPALAVYFEKNEKVNNGKAILNKTELGRVFGMDRQVVAEKINFNGKKDISLVEAVRQLVKI